MWSWLRKKRPVVEIPAPGGRVGIYLVPGVFQVVGVTYNTDSEVVVTLLEEDRFFRKFETH